MKTKLAYGDALRIAQEVAHQIAPVCERVLIAGSLRRKKTEVGDIELVVIPQFASVFDMFGSEIEQVSLLDPVLAALGCNLDASGNGGAKMRKFVYEDAPIDMFIQLSEDTWGVNATLRTGCADFSQWLVTDKRHGGAKPAGLSFKDGRIWENGKALNTPDEADVFNALELDWIHPTERTPERTATLWRR